MGTKIAIIEEIHSKPAIWKGGQPSLKELSGRICHDFSNIEQHAVLEKAHKDIELTGQFEQAVKPRFNAGETLWFALPSFRSNTHGSVRYAVEVVAYRGSYWHVLSRLVRYAGGTREVLANQLGTSNQGWELSPTDFTIEASGKRLQALFSIQESNREPVIHRLEAEDDVIPEGSCILIPQKNKLRIAKLEFEEARLGVGS